MVLIAPCQNRRSLVVFIAVDDASTVLVFFWNSTVVVQRCAKRALTPSAMLVEE